MPSARATSGSATPPRPIVAAIAAVIITVVIALGTKVKGGFDKVNNAMP
jgi:hypothetical protein